MPIDWGTDEPRGESVPVGCISWGTDDPRRESVPIDCISWGTDDPRGESVPIDPHRRSVGQAYQKQKGDPPQM